MTPFGAQPLILLYVTRSSNTETAASSAKLCRGAIEGAAREWTHYRAQRDTGAAEKKGIWSEGDVARVKLVTNAAMLVKH